MKSYDNFAFPLSVDSNAGTIAEQGDYDAYIRALIFQVLMTAQGERINRPEFGASLKRLVFSPLRMGTERLVQSTVLQALNRWLARYIKTQDVRVTVADEALLIEVDYLVMAVGETRYLTMEVAV